MFPVESAVEGMVKITIPDNMTSRTLLDIIYYIGEVHPRNPEDDLTVIVMGDGIYFKHEDDAIMFRLSFGV